MGLSAANYSWQTSSFISMNEFFFKRFGFSGFSIGRNQGKAFTLIETLMAIGIVSVAMVSILGLIPVGLNTFADAMGLSVESSIVQSVCNDILRTDYTNVTAALAKSIYYDREGRSTNYGSRLYSVEISEPRSVSTQDQINSEQALIANSESAEPSAWTVQIKVARVNRPATTNNYFVIIPKGN
jgi:uncharacterized protein (TIGR02598 family)